MSRILLFIDGLSYLYQATGKVMHFQRGIPQEVDDNVASVLLRTGRFQVLPYKTYNALTDFTLSVRFTGTIGDAVTVANCVGAISRDKPHMRVVGLAMDAYHPICRLIAPLADFRGWFTQGHGKLHVDMGSAARTGGEGFAWEAGIAYALGYSHYPPPGPISFEGMDGRVPEKILKKRERGKLAVIHFWSAHSKSKSYHPGKVSQLCVELQNLGYDVVIIGCADEPVIEGSVIDMRGRSDVVEAAYLLSIADVAVTVDSWAFHMAKLVKIPQVVLFGSLRCDGKPQLWETTRVLRGELCEGKKCNVYACPHGRSNCIDSIDVFAILDAVQAVVEEHSKKKELVEV